MSSSPFAALPGMFIAGTDTAAGKTTLACALLRLAHRLGIKLIPFKPVETGCAPLPLDADRLRAAACRPDIALQEICPFTFEAPVAPAAAAASKGVSLTIETIRAAARKLATAHGSALLVEPAGGLLTPYAGNLTTVDIAVDFQMPVLLAARNALGTINHTALTINEIRRRGLDLVGLVLVETTPTATPDRRTNAALIESVSGVRALGTLPFIPSAEPDALADALALAVNAASLLERIG